MALASSDAITLIETSTGEARAIGVPNLPNITAIAILPDSTRLLIGTAEGKLAITDIRSGDRKDAAVPIKGAVKVLVTARSSPLIAVVTEGQLTVVDLSNERVVAQTSFNTAYVSKDNVAFVDNDRRVIFPDEFKAVVWDIASGRRVVSTELKSNMRVEGRSIVESRPDRVCGA